MEHIILFIQVIVIAAAVVYVLLLLWNGDQSAYPRWAKVRIRVDNGRRERMPDPREDDETDAQAELRWLMLTGIMAVIVMVLAANHL